jgi:hypothetical protein
MMEQLKGEIDGGAHSRRRQAPDRLITEGVFVKGLMEALRGVLLQLAALNRLALHEQNMLAFSGRASLELVDVGGAVRAGRQVGHPCNPRTSPTSLTCPQKTNFKPN